MVATQLDLAGIPTAVLQAGAGRPVVLLHEQGELASRWQRVVRGLAGDHRLIAPDLPGHGGSRLPEGRLDADRVLAWLGELIDRTCPTPPVVVGHMLGGAMALRFGLEHPDKLDRLVVIDTFGLRWFRPAPRLALALMRYIRRPSEASFERLYEHCAADADALRASMGEGWHGFRADVLAGATSDNLKTALPAMMRAFGVRRIPGRALGRVAVPVSLIWGRQDTATPLKAATRASRRYGWPLQVIDGAADDPVLEQPDATARAIRGSIDPAPDSPGKP
jgi:pimeloyl-ACP methyl ester carboxylesterase